MLDDRKKKSIVFFHAYFQFILRLINRENSQEKPTSISNASH